MAYNNGISTVADSIVIDEESSSGDLVTIAEITGWQIVNGGQTTASIYNAFQAKLPLDKVNFQIKLSVIKSKEQAEDIIHNISKYANSQNKINMSDFNMNVRAVSTWSNLAGSQPSQQRINSRPTARRADVFLKPLPLNVLWPGRGSRILSARAWKPTSCSSRT